MNNNLGVVVARFQTDDLTEGQLSLLNTAFQENGKLLVLLGNHPFPNTIKDPLDFQTRVKMVQGKFPDAIIAFVQNRKDDNEWVKLVEQTISSICPMDKPIMYWGRDSSMSTYQEHGGKYPCKEIAHVGNFSGTERRIAVSRNPIDSVGFRKGCIYSAYNRYAHLNSTADIACLRNKDGKTQVLLGCRSVGMIEWRFPGGFVDPEHDNSHLETAQRELREEVGHIEVSNWEFVGSQKIDDWRADGESGQYIMTNLYVCDLNFGTAKGMDDLSGGVGWFNIDDLANNKANLAEEHHVLLDMLVNHLEKKQIPV